LDKLVLTSLIAIRIFVPHLFGQQVESLKVQSTPPQLTQINTPSATPLESVKTSVSPPVAANILDARKWSTDTWTAIAAIVAFFALVQPWLLAFWRRVFNRGTLEIYEAATIEIGFGGFGPSIGLMGTLRAIHKDMFVQSISLHVVKETSLASHDFEWRAFRDPKLSFAPRSGQSAEVLFQVPTGFTVSSLQSHRFNVVFSDQAAVQPAVPIFQKLQQEWISRTQKLDLQTSDLNTLRQPAVVAKLRRALSDLSVSPTYEEAVNTLNKLNYWEAGKYHLTMIVQTARPHKTVKESWSFTIPENESLNLQNNVVLTVQEALVPSGVELGFIYVAYDS